MIDQLGQDSRIGGRRLDPARCSPRRVSARRPRAFDCARIPVDPTPAVAPATVRAQASRSHDLPRTEARIPCLQGDSKGNGISDGTENITDRNRRSGGRTHSQKTRTPATSLMILHILEATDEHRSTQTQIGIEATRQDQKHTDSDWD